MQTSETTYTLGTGDKDTSSAYVTVAVESQVASTKSRVTIRYFHIMPLQTVRP
jgi:hypothetical protein